MNLIKMEREGQRTLHDQLSIANSKVKIDGKEFLNLQSNDYLGIAGNLSLRKEFAQHCKQNNWALGSTGSRLLSGNHELYHELESKICSLYKVESCLLFNSGMHANIGVIPALTTSQDLIVCDRNVHASLYDGMRIGAAHFMRFTHNDMQDLENILKAQRSKYRNVCIVVESLYSMDGDWADLRRIVALKRKYNCMLYLDEAHSVGIIGSEGLGMAIQCELMEHVDVAVLPLGKAMGAMGALVLSNKKVRTLLIDKCRSLIYSTALPAINVAWISFVFEKIGAMDTEREGLKKKSIQLRKALTQHPLESGIWSPIIPIIVGQAEQALELSGELIKSGYWCKAILPPTVNPKQCRIRITCNVEQDEEDLKGFVREVNRVLSGHRKVDITNIRLSQ